MPTYRLDLEYDGASFHGFQIQPGVRTVQGDLESALERLSGGPVRVIGAGRTDAGVHAVMQVASFASTRTLEPRTLLRALGGLLAPDVRVWRAGEVDPSFSARGSALARRYVYRMLRHPSALGRRHAFVLRCPVDAARMAAAAEVLVGAHDFTAFAAAASAAPGRDCVVHAARILADADRVDFDIAANRFLYNMVRRLSGVLVEVGRGRLDAGDVARILAERDTSRGGPCLPADGLFLVEVRYPPDARFAATAVQAGAPALPTLSPPRGLDEALSR